MYETTYPDLLELQSLRRKIHEHQMIIQSQEKRTEQLDQKVKNTENEILEEKKSRDENRLSLKKHENSLESTIIKIHKTQDHLQSANSQHQADSGQKELDFLEKQKETLEDLSLKLMEELERQESKIQQMQDFLKGAFQSQVEIHSEAKTIITAQEKEISHLNQRYDYLLEQLKPNVARTYKSLVSTYKYNNPVALINEHHCSECNTRVNPSTESQIQHFKVLEHCEGCSRLLVIRSYAK